MVIEFTKTKIAFRRVSKAPSTFSMLKVNGYYMKNWQIREPCASRATQTKLHFSYTTIFNSTCLRAYQLALQQ